MNARWIRPLSVALALFVGSPLWSAEAAKTKAKSKAAPRTPPPAAVEPAASVFPAAELTIGFQTRESETEGIGDLLIPVWNPGGTGLLFVNPRSAFTDHDAEEANLGIGYRQLLPKQKIILGANAYYDYRDTGYSSYDQWGVGFEILTAWIDARANYYDPDDKKHVVGSQTETSTSQSLRISEDWSDPFAEGHAIAQDYTLTRTLTTLTTTKTFEQYEQALGGYDWELGLRLPLPVRSETLEARVFGGAYDFDRDFGDDAKGWKARAELRVLSSLFLDAGVYENADLTGSDWYAGARLSVPLDLSKISQGRNPFATAQSRLNAESRDFSSRLTEMVMRDPQIHLETSKLLENKALETADTQKDKKTQRERLVLLSDVQFVDGDAAAAADGSAERPFPSIQLGVDQAFGQQNVYVFNASGPYNENVVLRPDITLWGSGVLVPGGGGKSFGSGIAPVVDGRSLGPTITLADRTTVRGFTVQNTELGGPNQPVVTPGIPTYDIRRAGLYGLNATEFTVDRNTLSGNEMGALFVAADNSLDFLFTGSRVTGNDIGAIVLASGGGDGHFFADFQDSSFDRNNNGGILLDSQGYLESVARFRNGSLSENPMGLQFHQSDNMLAMAMISGAQANNNIIGLQTVQENNTIGLVNISDSVASGNMVFGIQNFQESQAASVGVIGMPEGMADTANAAAALFGLALPDEVGLFLSPSGPITANGNGFFGVQSVVQAEAGLALGFLFDVAANGNGIFGVDSVVAVESGLALGALFDIVANGNGDIGINAVNQAEQGVAVGLAGSTDNLADLVQLGTDVAGLLGLDLPLAITRHGHMEANGNGDAGFRMVTAASNAALNAVIGLNTVGNGGTGTLLGTYSEDLSVAALARLNTIGNANDGLLFNTIGNGSAAVGLLADVNASGNGGDGINATVFSSDGIAALLSLSTDALRPLASVLGEQFLGSPFELPGDPFGPVVASGNQGVGFSANVTGNDLSLAAFLDNQANQNGLGGFDVTVTSITGQALAAFLSSDLLYDVLPEALGLDPIPFTPLGGVAANDNGADGIHLTVTGYDAAMALFAGVDASSNRNASDGIDAQIASADGGPMAFLAAVDAFDNAGRGIGLDLLGSNEDISLALIDADASGNAQQGIQITATSVSADVLALLAGGDAWDNGGTGIEIDLDAGGDAAVAITDTYANFNGGNGLLANLHAGADARLFVGDTAAADFDAIYDYSSGLPLGLVDLIPHGIVVLNGNANNGLEATLDSDAGGAFLDVDGIVANRNVVGDGVQFDLTVANGPGDARAVIADSTVRDNGNLSVGGAVTTDAGDASILLDHVDWNAYVLGATTASGTTDITITP